MNGYSEKVCPGCHVNKPIAMYHKGASRCKQCVKTYQQNNKNYLDIRRKEYKEQNKEKIKESQRMYRINNTEKRKKSVNSWKQKNQEHTKEYQKNWIASNKEHIKIYQKNTSCERSAKSIFRIWGLKSSEIPKDLLNAKIKHIELMKEIKKERKYKNG